MGTGRAVIGANFGDEGKGLMVDYLCSQGAGVVVRFNGGAQAGHTVVTPDGMRHVFHHFGSGTLLDVPTYLSEYFVCNPILFFKEVVELRKLYGLPRAGHLWHPTVFAHPKCLVTTFADMMINQIKEGSRGADRHGSCGIGFHETQVRSKIPGLSITMADLWNGKDIRGVLRQICVGYASFRTGKPLSDIGTMKLDEAIEQFAKAAERFAGLVHPAGMEQCKDPVFEGSQGLLLDQNNTEFFPHVTHSNTGMQNVRALAAQVGMEIEPYYVSRTYLTRHGAGKLPGESTVPGTGLRFEDDTNVENPWQGELRFAPLDPKALMKRILKDAKGIRARLVFTHCDQWRPGEDPQADLYSYGPTRADIEERMR
jgi:adenylosuccinate synthase